MGHWNPGDTVFSKQDALKGLLLKGTVQETGGHLGQLRQHLVQWRSPFYLLYVDSNGTLHTGDDLITSDEAHALVEQALHAGAINDPELGLYRRIFDNSRSAA